MQGPNRSSIQASNCFLLKRLKMRLLPLLDAYQAPYKDKFRFWTALMLVIRSILLVGFGMNILGDPDINHLLTITVLSILLCCIWMTGIVYKTIALSILEASFILNLLILSGWTIYNRHASNRDSSDGQTALVCTSTGIAFNTFICIVLPCLPSLQVFKTAPIFQEKQNQEGRQKDEWGSRRVCGVCC